MKLQAQNGMYFISFRAASLSKGLIIPASIVSRMYLETAALFFSATALDIFLPRILAGERITARDVARAGHGGLCHFCPECTYPICPFGRGA